MQVTKVNQMIKSNKKQENSYSDKNGYKVEEPEEK